MFEDTIAAIATPLGAGGLAVLRVSGPLACAVADRCFVPAGRHALLPSAAPTHTLHYGHIVAAGRRVDEVMLAVMRAPRTFTREDVVEISCHGGVLPARLVLDALLAAGARAAEPGEFTRRAFVNGRIDLTQAEAVADVIHSRTELALAAANEQLAGHLSRRIEQLRADLLHVLAHVEAHIDFPDEDISPATRTVLLDRLDRGLALTDELLRTAPEGQLLRRGVRAAIIGRPNSGKSSLLNQLLGHNRAIVSPVAGTTRDTIEETANIRGVPVVFIDTAGLRAAGDEIEAEGIRRSRAALQQAELVLHVCDGGEPLHPGDTALFAEFAHKRRVLVRNKADQPARWDWPAELTGPRVATCCVTGAGIAELKDAIKALVWRGEVGAGMDQVMINARHQDALLRARAGIERTAAALRAGLPLELPALDLRLAVGAVGEIVGRTSTEDLLDAIFSQFCIGK